MPRKINDGYQAFQKLIEVSSWGIILLDAQFKVIYRSPSAERINGWDKDVRTEDVFTINIHPDDFLVVNALMQTVAQTTGATETCTFRSKDSEEHYIWLQCSFTNMLEVQNVQAIVCNFLNVSEQKLVELELIKKSEQITELLETMTDGFISLDENLCYTYANSQALKMAQKTLKEVVGRYIWDVFPDAIGTASYEAIQNAYFNKEYVCNEGFYPPYQLWQENRAYPSGKGVSVFMRDITKQKKEVHHHKLLESVITNTTDSVLITEAEPFDHPGPRILYVNEAFTQMTGYTAEEVIGKTPRILQGAKTDKAETHRLGECLRRWESCEATLINYKKNGEEFWINLSISPVADENGWFTHWISIERDVTERKIEELQQAFLSETGRLFNESMKLNPLLDILLQKVVAYDHFLVAEIWLTGVAGRRMILAGKTARTPETAIFYEETSEFKSIVKGESLPGIVCEKAEILVWNDLDENPNFVRKHAAKNAGIKTAYGIPLISEKSIIGVLVVGLGNERADVAKSLIPLFEKIGTHFGVQIKRKQLEEELNQVFTLAPDIICILGTDKYLTKVNPSASTLLGYTETELLGQQLDAFIHPDDISFSTLRFEKFIEGEKNLFFENRFITKTGDIVWLSWTAHLNEPEGLLFCVGKDVTDKKQTEQKLYASESNLNAVFENTDSFIYSLNQDLQFVTYNVKLSKLMEERFAVYISPGYSVFDLIEIYEPAELDEWKKVYARGLKGEVVEFEKLFVEDNRHIYTSFSIHPIWQNDRVTGVSCFVKDITNRKLSEMLLTESENRYSELFHLSPLPKLVFDLETSRFLDVNKVAIEQYGYTKAEFLELSIEQLLPPEDVSCCAVALMELKQKTGVTAHYAMMHQKKNGEQIRVDMQSNPVNYKGKNARIAVARDVTETLNYIDAIEAKNEKLKEISWMQSHIVRAPLARMMGLIPLISDTDSLPEETKKMMGYLLQSARELDEVIREISSKTEVIDPKKIVNC